MYLDKCLDLEIIILISHIDNLVNIYGKLTSACCIKRVKKSILIDTFKDFPLYIESCLHYKNVQIFNPFSCGDSIYSKISDHLVKCYKTSVSLMKG